MDILKDIINIQNLELLQRIANDMYVDDVEKQDFIGKYHKKNFGIIIPIKKDNTEKHIRTIKHCVK
tara:strand:+ start:847 stop:1044 length:198 start_codon:yes stop_codon:yes gene_type:complete